MRGAYRDDDIADCLGGYGSVGFVVEKRLVGSVRVPVETVGRQCGHLVLLRLPLIVGDSLVCGEDDQRLAVEAGQGRRLCDDLEPSRNSSMKLARCRAVEELARASSRERGGRVV